MARRLHKLIILGGVSVLLSIAGSGAALAQGTEQGALVVDTANQHVFAASGAGTAGVDVYDLDGTKLATLDAPNASGLTVLSGTLWDACAVCHNQSKIRP